MKYLSEFYTYIKENIGLKKSTIEEMLLPISDLGIKYIIKEGTTLSVSGSNKNNGKKYFKIRFIADLNNSELVIDSSKINIIDDERIWEFLEEIITIKNRLNSFNSLINFIQLEKKLFIELVLISNEKVDINKLVNISYIIKSKLNSMKTEFAYNTLVKLNDNNISIESRSYTYTDRKFNNLIRNSIEVSGFDINDFNIEKISSKNSDIIYHKITLKNS